MAKKCGYTLKYLSRNKKVLKKQCFPKTKDGKKRMEKIIRKIELGGHKVKGMPKFWHYQVEG